MRVKDRQEQQNINLLFFLQIHPHSRTKPISKHYISLSLFVVRNDIINITVNAEGNLIVQGFKWTSLMTLEMKVYLFEKLSHFSAWNFNPCPCVFHFVEAWNKRNESINFHVSGVIIFASSAVRSVLYADKDRWWSNLFVQTKLLFVFGAPLIPCA